MKLTVGQLKKILQDVPDHYRIATPDVDVYGVYSYIDGEDDVYVDDEYELVELNFADYLIGD